MSCTGYISSTESQKGINYCCLKEKLPQAFMQIRWMDGDFRNLTAKFGQIWIIQPRDMIFQRFHYFRICRPLRWYSSNICDVTTVQLSNGTVHNFFFFFKYKISLFMKMYLPSSFILRYVGAEMNVHAWTWSKGLLISKNNKKLWKSMYKVNGELSSCDITYSGRAPSREGDIHNFA